MKKLEELQQEVWDGTDKRYKSTKGGKKYVLETGRPSLVLLSSLTRDECETRLSRMKKA